MKNSITLKHIGYHITGKAYVTLWDNSQRCVEMRHEDIIGPITKDKLLACINDGQFECKSIRAAHFWIYDLYECGYAKLNRDILCGYWRINKYAKRGI